MEYPFEPFPVLSGERVWLRALRDEDLDAMFRLRADAAVAEILCREAFTEPRQAEERIAFLRDDAVKHKSITWVICPAGTNEFLGSICLWSFSEEKNKAEIGYELLPEHRGEGYMRDAVAAVVEFGFREMRLSYLDAYPPKNNPNSIRLLERCGFRKTAETSEKGPNGKEMNLWVYELDGPGRAG